MNSLSTFFKNQSGPVIGIESSDRVVLNCIEELPQIHELRGIVNVWIQRPTSVKQIVIRLICEELLLPDSIDQPHIEQLSRLPKMRIVLAHSDIMLYCNRRFGILQPGKHTFPYKFGMLTEMPQTTTGDGINVYWYLKTELIYHDGESTEMLTFSKSLQVSRIQTNPCFGNTLESAIETSDNAFKLLVTAPTIILDTQSMLECSLCISSGLVDSKNIVSISCGLYELRIFNLVDDIEEIYKPYVSLTDTQRKSLSYITSKPKLYGEIVTRTPPALTGTFQTSSLGFKLSWDKAMTTPRTIAPHATVSANFL